MNALAPRIAALTDELLEGIAARGSADLIKELAYPLPVIVIAELMGIGRGDYLGRRSDSRRRTDRGLDRLREPRRAPCRHLRRLRPTTSCRTPPEATGNATTAAARQSAHPPAMRSQPILGLLHLARLGAR